MYAEGEERKHALESRNIVSLDVDMVKNTYMWKIRNQTDLERLPVHITWLDHIYLWLAIVFF